MPQGFACLPCEPKKKSPSFPPSTPEAESTKPLGALALAWPLAAISAVQPLAEVPAVQYVSFVCDMVEHEDLSPRVLHE